MTKATLKKIAKELFKAHMGIDIAMSDVVLCESSVTREPTIDWTGTYERVTYLWFKVGHRHYVYADRLYKSFAMFPDYTLTDGIELMR